MKKRYKFGIGCLVILVAMVGFGAWTFLSREPRAIVVADAGADGRRVEIGGMPANFYPASGPGPHPAVLLLGGSEGGLKEERNAVARQLSAAGYSVLYQAYFETSEDNRALERVPLEIFDRAIDWLAREGGADPARIAVMGHSKGAEAALLVAGRNPDIAAVIAGMPSDVVWQGFDFNSIDVASRGSSWTASGRDLPFVSYITPPWYEWMTGGQATLAKMYQTSWDARGKVPDAAIELKSITAPVLLVCGSKDEIWPSCTMARAAAQRLPDATLLAYDKAGHWAFGPADQISERDRKLLGRLGGTAEADLAARRDQWPKILALLDKTLAPDTTGGD